MSLIDLQTYRLLVLRTNLAGHMLATLQRIDVENDLPRATHVSDSALQLLREEKTEGFALVYVDLGVQSHNSLVTESEVVKTQATLGAECPLESRKIRLEIAPAAFTELPGLPQAKNLCSII